MRDSMVVGFEAPWVNVLVRLAESHNLLFVSILDEGPGPRLAVGAPVEVVFKDVTASVTLPYFRLAAATSG
jgi:hypothetical protein